MGLEQKPIISIITVCLNAETTIEYILRSVVEQENVDGLIEHIVVDGASGDGTLDVVQQFSHVQWISEPDDGIFDALNKGSHLATGEYLMHLFADDYLYDVNVLSDVIAFIRSRDRPDWIAGDVARAKVLDGEMAILGPRRRVPPTCRGLILRDQIAHPAVFLKREVFIEMGGFDTTFRIMGDYDLWQRLCSRGYRPVYFRRVISVFRLGGISSQRSPLHLSERARILASLRDTPAKRLFGGLYDCVRGRKG